MLLLYIRGKVTLQIPVPLCISEAGTYTETSLLEVSIGIPKLSSQLS